MPTIQRILVPIDFSSDSQNAIVYAALLSRALGASLTLLHVGEEASSLATIVPGARPEEEAARARIGALATMDRIRTDLAKSGLTRVDAVFATGPVLTTILDFARLGFDMIVMASHRRRGVERLVMGSVAEGVARLAECPLLTMHLPPQ